MTRARQVKNGEPIRYYKRKDGSAVIITRCCDCSLVHVEQLKPTARYIMVRVWRDEKRTQESRRRKRPKDRPRRKA